MLFLTIFRSVVLALVVSAFAASPSAAQGQAAGGGQPVPLLAPGQGLFLHLSDIHFDPFDVGDQDRSKIQKLVDELIDKDVLQWEDVFQSYHLSFPQAGSGDVDTNYPLLISALTAASQHGAIDYVIHTGDYLRHDFVGTSLSYIPDDKVRARFTAQTVEFVNLMIRKYIKGAANDVPLVGTLGNNDTACDDYQLSPPDGSSADTIDKPFLAGVGSDLLAHDPAALGDFQKGGYYVIPYPNPKVKNHDFVVLSVLWAGKYQDQCGPRIHPNPCDSKDPGRPSDDTPGGVALCWLAETLAKERQAGRKVTLVMHIPPGIDSYAHSTFWKDQYNEGFVALVAQYADILRDGYAGHTHEDEFRVLADQRGAYLAVHMAPSVTPYRDNWPAFTIFIYDTATETR